MTVDIHGNDYSTVAERVNKIREDYPDYTIETQLIKEDDYKVIFKCLIMDGERLLSTGYAEEVRGNKPINITSALENCETSAVGRALAFFRYAGTEIRSADEMRDAVDQQTVIAAQIRGVEIGRAQFRHELAVEEIKDRLTDGDYLAAYEIWAQIDNEEKKLLWIAPSKGGCFTTEERKKMQSTEWIEARSLYHENHTGGEKPDDSAN